MSIVCTNFDFPPILMLCQGAGTRKRVPSRILDHPKCIVQNLEWTNDKRFLGIYCLETASDTIVIYGFLSIPNFYRT